MTSTPKLQRFILMPPRGLTASASPASAHVATFMRTLAVAPATAARGRAPRMRVLDSVHEDGLKLVEMSEAERIALRKSQPGMRVVPEVFYQPRNST